MNNHSRKAAIYAVLLLVFFVAVALRIHAVNAARGRQIVSFSAEWAKAGKPVEARMIQAADVSVYARFTVTVDMHGQTGRGFVTGDIRDTLRQGQAIYDETKSSVCASVKHVGNDLDMDTGMFPVEIAFDSPCPNGGLFVVSAHTATLPGALAVPNEVLGISSAGDYYLWKIENGVAKQYTVTVASRNGYGAIITDGLKSGDTVIFNGQSLLQDNDPVMVVGSPAGNNEGRTP